MKLQECRDYLTSLFGLTDAVLPDEFGFTDWGREPVTRVGYATNLTPAVVQLAIDACVDLIVTHHDAWEFVHGMKAECLRVLARHAISHVFVHQPLDAAEFGPAASLVRALDVGELTGKFAERCGGIATLRRPLDFSAMVARMESVCEESVMSWRNHDRPIRIFGVVPGGAPQTGYVKECLDAGCDLYITGEKTLYTIQYAEYAGINLIIGSHTFTEIFGVESLVGLLAARFPELQVLRLPECHTEADGLPPR